MFPLTFVANTFAPTDTMPRWLRVIAEWNPVSALTAGCRQLWGNGDLPAASAQLPLQHPVTASLIWSVVFTAVFAPLAVSAFKRRSQD
jgi:ABC-type multidrug transport system permease subunit